MKLLSFGLLLLLAISGCKKQFVSNYNYSVQTTFGEIVFETNDESEASKYALNLNLISKYFGSNYCYFVIERKN